MISEHGWLPRNVVVTTDIRRIFGAPDQRLVEVLTWRGWEPIGSGPVVCGVEWVRYIRVRPHHHGPWCYESVKRSTQVRSQQ